MPEAAKPHSRLILALGIILALLVFTFDVTQPLGTAAGMAYVPVILLGLWLPTATYPLWAAIAATLLVGIDTIVGWVPDPPADFYTNRPLMLVLFWSTAAVVVRFRALELRAARQVKDLADLKYALDQAAIVATTDIRGRITYVNDKFCEISKYSADELLGQDHRIINSGLHPSSFFHQLWYTIASGRVWHGEIRNRAKDGTLYWVDTTIVPFVDSNGKPYQYTAIRSDITERKTAEERLREQAALARLGQMAAVVAHEVKNPLAGIRGVMQVMLSRRAQDDPDVPVMREIIVRVDALAELVQDLLLFARPRSPRRDVVELRPLVLDAVASLRRDPVGSGIAVEITGDEVAMTADSELLKAALLNLLLNAAQAMSGQGAIEVAVHGHRQEVTIEIADRGPGIAPELHDRVFEPFFTTKSRGGGLGLPIVRRTVELHGGTVAVDQRPGGGTLVTIRLPLEVTAASSSPAV